jgi:AcrR family transcriptional regulator
MVQERAIRTRAAVLAAARAVFARSGFDGARIDAIAARAKANKQRIYAYFGSKEGLFAAVQSEAIATLAAFEEELLPMIEAEPRRMGTLLLSSYLRFHREHPEFWRLLAWANLGSIAPAGKNDRRAAILARLRAAFVRSQADGGAPSEAGFDAWFLALTAVVVFLFANQQTASVNLGMDLKDMATRDRLAAEVLEIIGPRAGSRR